MMDRGAEATYPGESADEDPGQEQFRRTVPLGEGGWWGRREYLRHCPHHWCGCAIPWHRHPLPWAEGLLSARVSTLSAFLFAWVLTAISVSILQNKWKEGYGMTATQLKGVFTALVTPFHENGDVNYGELGKLLDWQIESGVDGILILGTTGESPTLTHAQDDAVCQFTINRVAKRVPVIAGIGSNCTETQLDKGIRYAKMGADALLAITPYYVKANEEGMYRHFAEVADQASAPVILYNVPGRTGCGITHATVARLAAHPNIIGIKEASGDIGYAARVARLVSDDFALLSGNDDMILPLLSLGGTGVISVWSNVMPAQVHQMVMDYLEGRTAQATVTQLAHLELIDALFCEVNPIPVKEALNLMGWNVGGYRLPLYPMAPANRDFLAQAMGRIGLIQKEG